MKRNKYDVRVLVSWRDVLRHLEWCLSVRKHSAERWMDEVQIDIEHKYPDCFHRDLCWALGFCEQVFDEFELINTVRRFLRYKPKTAERLGIQRCYDFYSQYKKESPGSVSLAARTTGGRSVSE